MDNRPAPKPTAQRRGARSGSDGDAGANEVRLAMKGLVAAALSRAPEEDLEAAASVACAVAHERRISIERVLVLLRSEWDDANQPGGLPPDTREAVRVRLVSRCIRQFYERQS